MSSRNGPRSAIAVDNSRRIHRGRGGANDRKLPKHHARKRNPDQEIPVIIAPKYDGPPKHHRQAREEPNDTEVNQEHTPGDGAVLELPSSKEIRHCKQRIENVQESIQLSSSCSPGIWQQNVLNAVTNCVTESFSIFNHYKGADEIDPMLRKEMSLALFVLTQLGMQSGPLAGGKPGYFKRCGSDVAKIALSFLNEAFPEDIARMLGFTEKQLTAIQKWRSNAQKVAESDKPPSKSALKKQAQTSKEKK